MAEGTYEYECMRAELLGTEKPDYDEFVRRQKEQLAKAVAEEQAETECLTNSANANVTLNSIGSRLDELNTILANTQKRLSRFKTSCGTFTNMLKAKIGRQNSNSSLNITENAEATEVVPPQNATVSPEMSSSQRRTDLCMVMDGNLEKLDSLIDKAEMAQYNMQDQRKQMEKFLK